MKQSSDANQTLHMKHLGALAAVALLAGLLLHQVFATASANAAESDLQKKTAQAAFEEVKQAGATAQAATSEATELAGTNVDATKTFPPQAPTPPPPPQAYSHLTGVMALAIPIIAIVLGVGVAVLAIWTEYKKRVVLMEICHKERMTALEKGLELPPLPQEQSEAAEAPKTGLKGGLIWLALGIGLGLFLGLQPKPAFHPALSAIPITLGLAYLAYYGIEGRKHTPPVK